MTKMKPQKIGENMKEDTRIALLEQSIGHINDTLVRFEKRFDRIDTQFELLRKDMQVRLDLLEKDISKGFDKTDNKLESLNNKMDSNLKWMITLYLGGFAGLFGIIAHSLHLF